MASIFGGQYNTYREGGHSDHVHGDRNRGLPRDLFGERHRRLKRLAGSGHLIHQSPLMRFLGGNALVCQDHRLLGACGADQMQHPGHALPAHIHVFADKDGNIQPAGVKSQWERIKAEEKAERAARRPKREADAHSSLLSSVKASLPALTRAMQLQQKASTVGFDWNDPRAVLNKIREEADEIEAALDRKDAEELAEETGDLLFAVVNLARHGDIHGFTLNQLVRTRHAYAARGLAVLVLDGSADLSSAVQYMAAIKRPVTVIATSLGTIRAAQGIAHGARPDTLVLTSGFLSQESGGSNNVMQGERPVRMLADGVICFNSLTSRRSREVSSARVATRINRSDLNGFSMKS